MNTNQNSKRRGRPQKGRYKKNLHATVSPKFFAHDGKYVVYGLSSTETPEFIEYVGFTARQINKRYNDHVCRAYANGSPKEQWVKELLDYGHQLVLTMLEDGIDAYEKACEREKYFISILDEIYPLKNAMKGCNETRGMKHSPETREKQSRSHRRLSASKRNRPQRVEEKKN